MARTTDHAQWLGNHHFGCQCVENAVDVDGESTDGRTFILSIGGVQVAELVITSRNGFSIAREREQTGDGPVNIAVVFEGTARWLAADLNAIQIANPGSKGTLQIQHASPVRRLFGERIDLPRTATIGGDTRRDRFAICNATTVPAVTAAAPTHADFRLANQAPTALHLPNEATVAIIRGDIASLNQAIATGDFATAAAITGRLGLPFPEDSDTHIDFNGFSNAQWHTAYVAGAVTMTVDAAHTNFTFQFDPNSRPLLGLHGTGHFVTLINDMAERGVAGLTAPPTFEQIHQYYKNVLVEHSHEGREAVKRELLAACQRVMAGMQVHYRQAGNTDPNWGPNATSPIVVYLAGRLVEERGQALVFPTVAAARAYTPPGPQIVPAAAGQPVEVHGPRPFPVQITTNTPAGYADSVSRDPWGRRFESDCEGMASFRLRTLPPGFAPAGAVSGRLLTGGIGHFVAVFYATNGPYYLSSNGKVPMPEQSPQGLGPAIEDEFVSIYSHRNRHVPADFNFGFRRGPAPGAETPQQREPIVDEIMQMAGVDDALHLAAHANQQREREDFDWANFEQWWTPPE